MPGADGDPVAPAAILLGVTRAQVRGKLARDSWWNIDRLSRDAHGPKLTHNNAAKLKILAGGAGLAPGQNPDM
jgi:hypothetical protein